MQILLDEVSDKLDLEKVLHCKLIDDLEPFEKAINTLKQQIITQKDEHYRKISELENISRQLTERLQQLQRDISKLQKNQFSYPETTQQLRSKIQEEFEKRNIDVSVAVFAELLELKDSTWQNAVEGYLNTQRFNLIVPPEYYDIAAQVYNENKEKIHSVALVNTQALDYSVVPQKNTLADVIISKNKYAIAYGYYLMNPVVCSQTLEELKKHSIAITPECMLYKSKSLHKINPAQYQEPYIGSATLKKQLELKKKQFTNGTSQLQAINEQIQCLTKGLDMMNQCNIESIQEKLLVPVKYHQIDSALTEKIAELKQAQNNPTYHYGEDSYQFKYAPNPEKKNLYDMMVSDINIGGNNLFSQVYQNDFHSEMEELFQKLTVSENGGQDVMQEYSDYRNYLDYDIEIRSRSGSRQMFSKIYGEKSGGETQTPYYVAIAASFAQVYNSKDSVRLIMLDEAFDKMDDGRIESMMNLFFSMNLQVILAAPSAKIEIIGPYVNSVLVVYREGYESVVEEHDL